MSRNKIIDVFRGILILMVVLGHSGCTSLHDIVFLFHMPLFFVLSGFLIKKDRCNRPAKVRPQKSKPPAEPVA